MLVCLVIVGTHCRPALNQGLEMPRKHEIGILTAKDIEHAKARASEWAMADGGGLSLVIRTDGAKRWLYRFSINSRRAKLWLGYWPDLSLSDARARRDTAAELVGQGEDPRLVRKVEAVTRRAAAATTFEAVAREWHEQRRGRWTPAHAERVMDSLVSDAFPDLGPLPISSITPPMVLGTVKKIERRGAVETAQRVLQRIGSVMRYAMGTNRAKADPTYKLSETLTAAKVNHRPAMPRGELPEYFRRLEIEPLHRSTRLAMDLLAVTFVRPGELRFGRWSEIDFRGKQWRIPPERMKMRVAHIVPLSKQAIAILTEQQKLSRKSEFIFPAQSDQKKAMSENTLSYALGRMGYTGIHCPHGFRALASTILNEQGFDADVIERQLAHMERNRVRAAYHRAAYLPERRKMLQWWADFLDKQKGKAAASQRVKS